MPKLSPERVIETLRAHLSSVKNIKGAEIYLGSDEVTSLLVEGSAVLRNAFFTKQEVAVRFFSEDSHSFGTCSDFDSDSLSSFFKELVKRSDFSLPGSMLISPIEAKVDDKNTSLVDHTFANTPLSEKIQRLLNLVHSFSKHDSRIMDHSRVQYKENLRTEWLWTTGSQKVLKRQLTRGDVLSRIFVQDENGSGVTETRFSETHFLNFDWAAISKYSTLKALRKLSGRHLESGTYSVLMKPLASRDWAKWLFQYFSARSLKSKNHPLKNKLGQNVADQKLRIYDDPLFTKRPGSVLWDSEGSPAGVHDYVSNGVFKTWATDKKSALELDIPNTANSRRTAVDQLPDIDFHNLIIEPGTLDMSELTKAMGTGLLVSEIVPLTDPKINPDEVLIQAWGTWVENGKELYNIKPVFIVEPLLNQLKNCVNQGRELIWTGRVASPCLLFENINIVGGQ